jgi:cytochrome c-type biogenesis protein CcmH
MRLGHAAAWLMLTAFLAVATPALAVLPSEMLPDPALEARARTISAELRCLVCQNQSIDDSDADLAHDLRVLVRERLKAGDSDQQVIDFIVARYGEFVLLKPRFSLRNSLLWATPVILIAAGGIFILTASRRRRSVAGTALSAEEKAALEAVLGREQGSSGKA